ncbi:hypothetical protein, partial [Photobacterium swingsii]|uniref:hypothetical protein n=1 Tax=Photobacterium swingsii TaxID=680026 RepID=UPI001955BD9C
LLSMSLNRTATIVLSLYQVNEKYRLPSRTFKFTTIILFNEFMPLLLLIAFRATDTIKAINLESAAVVSAIY